MLALLSPAAGQQFFTVGALAQFNKLFTYTGRTWQCPGETVELQCREDLGEGCVVEIATADDYGIRKCADSGDKDVVGVVALRSYPNGSWATVATAGLWHVAVVGSANTYSRHEFLRVHTTDGLARESQWPFSGIFAKILADTSCPNDGDLCPGVLHTVEHF
jgi:hypothetical protein